MKFSENGTCKKSGYGLYYEGTDEEAQGYEIYESNQVDGVKVPRRFLGIYKNRVIAHDIRKKSRAAAIKACKKHRKDAESRVTVKRRKSKVKRGY